MKNNSLDLYKYFFLLSISFQHNTKYKMYKNISFNSSILDRIKCLILQPLFNFSYISLNFIHCFDSL